LLVPPLFQLLEKVACAALNPNSTFLVQPELSDFAVVVFTVLPFVNEASIIVNTASLFMRCKDIHLR
jgi:hypothetical protein